MVLVYLVRDDLAPVVLVAVAVAAAAVVAVAVVAAAVVVGVVVVEDGCVVRIQVELVGPVAASLVVVVVEVVPVVVVVVVAGVVDLKNVFAVVDADVVVAAVEHLERRRVNRLAQSLCSSKCTTLPFLNPIPLSVRELLHLWLYQHSPISFHC